MCIRDSLRYVELNDGELSQKMLRDIAASYQFAIVDILLSKLRLAIDKTKIRVALIGGGVAANKLLREKASEVSGALAEQTNSFFDKMVTEGGFFGNLLGGISQVATLWGGEGLGMEGEAKTKYISEQMRKIDGQIAEQQALIESGDDFDWKMTNRKSIIARLNFEKERLGKVKGAARGGIIVNRPTYLPSSGIVVGEHGTYTGKGYASGGISDGGPEAIVPLGGVRGQQIMSPLAQSIAGSVMNQLQMDRVGLQADTGGGSQNVIDSSSTQIVNNNTIINPPKPSGPMLPGAGRDTAVSHFRHAA